MLELVGLGIRHIDAAPDRRLGGRRRTCVDAQADFAGLDAVYGTRIVGAVCVADGHAVAALEAQHPCMGRIFARQDEGAAERLLGRNEKLGQGDPPAFHRNDTPHIIAEADPFRKRKCRGKNGICVTIQPFFGKLRRAVPRVP